MPARSSIHVPLQATRNAARVEKSEARVTSQHYRQTLRRPRLRHVVQPRQRLLKRLAGTQTTARFSPDNTLTQTRLLRRRLTVSRQRKVMSAAIRVEAVTLPATAKIVNNASICAASIFFG